ncbi:NADH dehydrogenase [ubiquinone] 1 beta subcomplex subunit 2, mitochondrial-like [Cydia pomonella]|uniref:NADH dehydrogenase [ubiquinone] 1 beta subcomplex subunit 2, mitochondrial-like n=1 Tax=Cydia pomonella TaxID=82600 RepID=UPI002ADDE35F|nr:NADH dehydrogenase [ubiquinone] 1 beta subcomplex subunit 2, mitochondrial-like [Cydia pomonella]
MNRTVLSRALLLNSIRNTAKNSNQSTRNSGHGSWSYRVPPPLPSKSVEMKANIIGGLCWWWILHHIFTEPEHVYGEWPYIDPSTWTDSELGIPPDSAGPLKHK